MRVSISSLTRLLYEPVQAFLDSQVLINRKTRAIVQQYTKKPDFVLKTPCGHNTRTIKIPALTMAHVPSLSHKRMTVRMNVCTKRHKKRGRTVFRLVSGRRKSQYKISFTIESKSSFGLQGLQKHCSEQIVEEHSTVT